MGKENRISEYDRGCLDGKEIGFDKGYKSGYDNARADQGSQFKNLTLVLAGACIGAILRTLATF